MEALTPGRVIWVDLSPSRGREQSGHRPAVVVSSRDHLAVVDKLVVVLPCTRTDRKWPNHIELVGRTGLSERTFAMTEQPRTVSRVRVTEVSGNVSPDCFAQITTWLDDWLAHRANDLR